MKKTGDILHGAVNILFGILMLCILYATVVIDKSIKNPYPNTVVFSNWVYYLFALVLLWVLRFLLYGRSSVARQKNIGSTRHISPPAFYCALAAIALATGILQIIISDWVPTGDFFTNDFKYIAQSSWDLANGGSLGSYDYFSRSPNNVNIVIVLSWIYRILPNPRSGIWVGALLTNVSVVLAVLSVYNVTGKEALALCLAIVGEILVGLTWRAFMLYTDTYGMIFVALMLWIYTLKIKAVPKALLITLSAACGCLIKVTVLLVFMALIANEAIRWLRSDNRRLSFKHMVLVAVGFAAIFGTLFAIQGPIRRQNGYIPGEYPKGWQYMLMMGQNTDRLGTAGGNNKAVRRQYIDEYRDLAKVNRAFLRDAFNYVRQRGIRGNIAYYEHKLTVAYNDGYFNNFQDSRIYEMDQSFLYNLYVRRGKYYQTGATVFQILWNAMLLSMYLYVFYELCVFCRKRGQTRSGAGCLTKEDSSPACPIGNGDGDVQNMIRLLKIAILGVTLYLLCLEGRSKYLYMFMPVFLAAFGLMFHTMVNRASGAPIHVISPRAEHQAIRDADSTQR